MRDNRDQFSVHYDRIVNYNIPKVVKRKGQKATTPIKGGKTMGVTTKIIIGLVTLLLALGTILFFNQKSTDSDVRTLEQIRMENIAKGQIMGRP